MPAARSSVRTLVRSVPATEEARDLTAVAVRRGRGRPRGVTAVVAVLIAAGVILAAVATIWWLVPLRLASSSSRPDRGEIAFEQQGLSEETWGVALKSSSGGTDVQISGGSGIIFQVPYGVYTFSVSNPSGYFAYPGSGTFTVQAPNVTSVPVTFTANSSFPTPIHHVFLIMMENEGTDQIYGVEPYETELANTYAWGGDANSNPDGIGYYALCHPSQPNYLGITSGQALGCGSDAFHLVSVNNLGNLLDTANESWADWEESASLPCQDVDSGLYDFDHNPFPSYQDLGGNATGSVCSTHVLPIANLTDDFPYSSTPPAFTYVAPNILNDGHSSSAATGDSWLSSFIPNLIAEPWFASTVIFITYDESYGANPDSGYDGLVGGPVFMVAVSPYTLGVGALGTNASHYNTLSTMEWLLGLPGTGTGNDSTPNFPAMKGLFNFTASASDPSRVQP
jgi:phosphatidylinositol-3-phosphatase